MLQRVNVVSEGLKLPRTATVIPQAGVRSLYTISGVVRIRQLYGVVTTLIAGGANNAKFQFHPTGQTAIDLCAVADIGTVPLVVGQLIGVVFPPATAMAAGWGIQDTTQDFLIGPGTIDFNCTAAAGTGAFRFLLAYDTEPGAFAVLAP